MLTERELQQRKLVRVPDVVGLPLRKALLLVEQAGLRVGATLYKESYEEKDTVLEQKPLRGQMVYASEDVTLWVSRESYIKWLPAIYQRSDSTGRNVVRDLLWLVQHLFGSIEAQLDNIHLIFDSYETRSDFIPWLAAWSAMMLEPDWPENKKRRLIKKAMELYRWRGTVKGLGLFISLFTGFEPHLQENVWPYQGLRIGVSSTVGIDTVILPPVDKSHAFMVVMPHQFGDVTPESIIRLHEIIEMEKPAHTHYMLKFEEPRLSVEEREFYRIGVTSGINIGQEVVTPLPFNPDTGELEIPQERAMPQPVPEPSVYELFGTRKRMLPPIENAPKADNAPVEGREVRSSKFGFEGAREFKLDDIMRELLERAGVQVDGVSATVETGAPGAPDATAGTPANQPGAAGAETMTLDAARTIAPGTATLSGIRGFKAGAETGDDNMTGTVVGSSDAQGHVKGRSPKVEVDVDLQVKDKEVVETVDEATAAAMIGKSLSNRPATVVETGAKAEASKPEASKPEASKPEASKPEAASSEAKAEASKPEGKLEAIKVELTPGSARVVSNKETMALGSKTLNELETVRLAPPLSSIAPNSTIALDVDEALVTDDNEQTDKVGTVKPPENDSKK